ncbi:G-protein coupled receptor Mth2-like [Microplitis mediator]|uniref:G-protein coupled receptor Mth2-like n=1 Tax=Microplitis mediator TaxID=375433 RepID=UPI00255363E5|nr:G-protein coupled receptor Mth2-like [Microplitis mediator]
MRSLDIYRILVIFIFVISVDSIVSRQKCCPPNMIFPVKENSKCFISHNKNSSEYYEERNGDWIIGYFEDCSNETITELTEFNDKSSTISKSGIACTDVVRENDLTNISFVHYCNQAHEEISDPQSMSIRKCCPQGQRYDAKIRECVADSSNYFDVLNALRAFSHNNIHFLSIVEGPPSCNYSLIDYIISAANDTLVLNSDTSEALIQSKNSQTKISVNENNACFDFDISSGIIVVRACSDDKYCAENTCLRKCCPEDEAWIKHKCRKLSTYEGPRKEFHTEIKTFIESFRNNSKSPEVLNSTDYGLMIGIPFCNRGRMYPVMKPKKNWYFTLHGYIYISNSSTFYDPNVYCLEMAYDNRYDDGLYPNMCFEKFKPETEHFSQRFLINASLEVTSCIFLGLTLIMYVFQPSIQNLHGNILMCYVGSLFFAYAGHATIIFLILKDQNNHDYYVLDSPVCRPLGYIVTASYLLAFSWLHVLCYDIWWTFRGYNGAINLRSKKNKAQWKRFIRYSYRLIPAIAIILAIIIIDSTKYVPDNFRPNIGEDSCWFSSRHGYLGKVIYFYGPIGVAIAINVGLFISTIYTYWGVKADLTKCGDEAEREKRLKEDRTKLKLTIKLFVLMGIFWLIEVISFLINAYLPDFTWKIELFYAFDVYNCLQGFILWIFVFIKQNSCSKIKAQYRKVKSFVCESITSFIDRFRIKKCTSSSTITDTTISTTISNTTINDSTTANTSNTTIGSNTTESSL